MLRLAGFRLTSLSLLFFLYFKVSGLKNVKRTRNVPERFQSPDTRSFFFKLAGRSSEEPPFSQFHREITDKPLTLSPFFSWGRD